MKLVSFIRYDRHLGTTLHRLQTAHTHYDVMFIIKTSSKQLTTQNVACKIQHIEVILHLGVEKNFQDGFHSNLCRISTCNKYHYIFPKIWPQHTREIEKSVNSRKARLLKRWISEAIFMAVKLLMCCLKTTCSSITSLTLQHYLNNSCQRSNVW